MAKRKHADTFDVAGLKQVEQRLVAHRNQLMARLRDAVTKDVPDFDDAIMIRNAGQLLATTCLTIQNMPQTIRLAELTGESHAVPNLERCGLDGQPDDD